MTRIKTGTDCCEKKAQTPTKEFELCSILPKNFLEAMGLVFGIYCLFFSILVLVDFLNVVLLNMLN